MVNYVRDGKPASFWGLNGSASLHGKDLVLTVVNPHVSETRETEITIRGAVIKSGTTTVLTSSNLHAHNTFDQRNQVVPQLKDFPSTGRTATLQVPPASVTKLELTLS
jgi:alpha-L-arabinofuranosidase